MKTLIPVSATKDPALSFVPNFIADSVETIDYELLKNFGIKAIAFDIDNTLVPVWRTKIAPKVVACIHHIQDTHMFHHYVIATRNPFNRVKLAHSINTKIVKPSSLFRIKPSPDYFAKVIKETGFEPHEIVMIGDRIVHDIINPNRAGMVTILVKPLGGYIFTDYIDSTFFCEQGAQKKLRDYLNQPHAYA